MLLRDLATFYARCEDSGRELPTVVRRELDTFLGCGILQNGFLRVRCQDCSDDRLVAHLVDRVFPYVPVRQWVLSLPIQIRPMLAYDSVLSRAVLNTFLRLVFSWYRRQAKALGLSGAECGSVTAIQRFGSALNLNLHYHVLVMDGVFHQPDADAPPIFRALTAPITKEISELTRKIQIRVVRLFERRGVFNDDRAISSDEHALVAAYAESARGRIGFGENVGKLHARLLADAPALAGKDKRAAHISGFDLHANVRVKANDRKMLERLCRYILRPPLAQDRLSETADGRIRFEMKRQFSDGTTHMVFQPLEFIEKLVAIIRRARAHQVLYHGVLAPHAKQPSQVILSPADAARQTARRESSSSPAVTHEIRERRLTWAELMRRVFAIDVLKCEKCNGNRTILSPITQPDVISGSRVSLTSAGSSTFAKRSQKPSAPPLGTRSPCCRTIARTTEMYRVRVRTSASRTVSCALTARCPSVLRCAFL